MMYWHDGGDWGWGGWIVMGLMMAAFWALIVVVAVALLRSGSSRQVAPPSASGDSGDTAVRILDERFARGDIDADEYRTRRELLSSR